MTEKAEVTSPVPRAEWESVLRSDENAVVTQSLPWRDAVFASGRYQDVSALYEFSSGHRVLMPMARARWELPRAAVVTSWPRIWSVGGPVSQGGRITPAEATAVLADVTRRGTLATRITLGPQADDVWLDAAARHFRIDRGGCHMVDLAGGFDHVWQHKFRSSARTAVRKAERSGVEIEVDRSGRLLGVVSDLQEKAIRYRAAAQNQSVWLTRWRMSQISPTSPAQLALVARQFGSACATWVARSGGEPVAAIIVLRSGAHVKYWRGAMDKERATLVRANELLHRLVIEQACQEGARWYDMGGSPLGSPLAAFKEKLGASQYFTHGLHAEHPAVYAARAARKRAERFVKKTIRIQEL